MRSDRYVHPEFGLLSPTPRLRRELRMAFFSVLLGIGIGAAAVIAFSGTKTADDARVQHGVGSASLVSEERTEPLLGYNSSQAAGIEKELNKQHTSKMDVATDAGTTCEGNNSSCGNSTPVSRKPRPMRMPAADALAIVPVPRSRPDASAEMTSLAPSASEGAHLTRGQSEDAAADRVNADRVMNKKRHKIVRGPPPQDAPNYRDGRGAVRIGRGYNRPAGELDRAYALDRSYGSRGFWDWSR